MTISREDLLRHCFTKNSRLIEIGASYNPIVPKKDGWNTTIIDHADQATLQHKYQNETPDRIEPVDVVWNGTPIDELLSNQHGQFDGLIASHVGEHLPDLIGFLKSVDKLLKPSGVIVLALPDKRLCFDFFRPVTTTGMLLQSHYEKHARHGVGQVFDSHAYYAMRNGAGAWARNLPSDVGGIPKFHGTLRHAMGALIEARDDNNYHDAHGWCFTPTSFQLNILELHTCDVIPWYITRIERASGVEFYVWLERRVIKLSDEEVEAERHRLIMQMIREDAEDALLQLSPDRMPKSDLSPIVIESITEPEPFTVSAVIPLYNGSKFIANSLRSVVNQTFPPMEIIVVDDGSTDNGAEVVKEFAFTNPTANVVLLRKANGGQSSARNYGVKHARGRLIALLDQDDEWYPEHLETLLQPFLTPPAGQPLGWVYSDLDEVDVTGHVIHHNFLTSVMKNSVHPKRDLYRCIDRDMFILPSASLISRNVFNEVGGFDERLSGYEDDDLFMRIFRAGKQNVFLDTALSKWRIHEGSSSYTPRMRKSRMIYCRKLLEMFPDRPEKNIWLSRDTIVPRFYNHARHEYLLALQSGDLTRIADTLDDLRFLINVAADGDGINMMLSKDRAVALRARFARRTPESALRNFHYVQKLRPIVVRTLPKPVWRKVAQRWATYG